MVIQYVTLRDMNGEQRKVGSGQSGPREEVEAAAFLSVGMRRVGRGESQCCQPKTYTRYLPNECYGSPHMIVDTTRGRWSVPVEHSAELSNVRSAKALDSETG
jgi:hypothetical protein